MAENKYQAYQSLFDAQLASRNQQREDIREANDQNVDASEWEFWGSKLGAVGAVGAAALAFGGAPLLIALAAGAGSYIGGKAGADITGGYADESDFAETPFYQQALEDTGDDFESIKHGAETGRTWNALSDAFTAYTLSGGPIPGTSSATATTEVAASTELSKEAVTDMVIQESVAKGATKEAAANFAEQSVSRLFADPSKAVTLGDLGKLNTLKGMNFAEYVQPNKFQVLMENIFDPKTQGRNMYSLYMADLNRKRPKGSLTFRDES